ncbi:MAG: ABC transporter ATP-binding protein [Anaerolineae bacterium]|nr:ABC transporter ATP-binding protein [Anaerolineae bacterium]
MQPLLEVKDLRVHYHIPQGPVRAVEDVSFSLDPGERLGLMGESGSGKSTAALSLMRLIKPPGRIESGEVLLDGLNIMSLPPERMQQVRLAQIALISQGAMNSLNPVMRVRDQVIDGMRSHGIRESRRGWQDRVRALLGRVGLAPGVADSYPHELSGGMKQRVCIAIAISLEPRVIIADEPTSALDVVVQRRVMETLRQVQEDIGAAVILIGHDMGLMAQFVDRVAVMYASRLVEEGSARDIFHQPQHPYTQLLVASLPSLEKKGEFQGAPGSPPSLLDLPSGCVFHPRCPYVMERCTHEVPPAFQADGRHWAACFLLESGSGPS